ncbi:CCC motif membrane protein [Parasediminibacterium paludis]|uniref:CCC motif membrane protein n=1 Tax=Parasediminibacterium paludis TaxID=908966 RepID=A0ABV8PSX8_9BACT
METHEQQTQFQNFQVQRPLPNATAVLVLGILGIVLACCYGGGLILSIIALVLYGKDNNLYVASPELYTEASLKNAKAGRVCAIIGLSVSILYIIFIAVLIALVGVAGLSNPEAIRHAFGK